MQRIMEMIPHRHPFLMIDKVIDVVANQRATGIKNVSINEYYFQGHFPARPVMPGVLIIEAMAQTAAVLVVHTLGPESEGKLVYFMSVDNARFRRPVVPGDRLQIHVTKQRNRGNVWRFEGRAKVGQVDGGSGIRRDDPGRLDAARMPQIHPTAVVEPGATARRRRRDRPLLRDRRACRARRRRQPQIACRDRRAHHDRRGDADFPFASIGLEPQDLKYEGEASSLEIGRNNTIREHVTMNPGTEGGGMVTRVGDDCLFMVGAHVAHDCQIGNHVILANNATLAGHVVVGDYAIIGGLSRRASVRAHRPACDDRRHVRGGARRHSLRPGDRRPGAAIRAQYHRHAAPRLQPRGYPGPAQRLSIACSPMTAR